MIYRNEIKEVMMTRPYTYQLRHDQDGRIVEKTETIAGKSVVWTYSYDKDGRLHEAHLDGRLICQCYYDKEGRRIRDYLPATAGLNYRNYTYTKDNRLMLAGGNQYSHDENGFRSIWSNKKVYTMYDYSPDYRLLKMKIEDGDREFTFSHDKDGQRTGKYLNGRLIEEYQWLDFVRLAAFHDGESAYEFAYEEGVRTPFAMRRDDGAIVYLFYDQVGSLRVVADSSGNVIKEVLYDPFGGIIEDTNPSFLVPVGFAGGMHDRDLGFVRFGWRDYDVNTGRWTAPDPIGDRGGDPDWYGYCLDDPVNGVDPLGLYQLIGDGPGGRIVGGIIGGAIVGAINGGISMGPVGTVTGAAVGGALGGLGAVYGEIPNDLGRGSSNGGGASNSGNGSGSSGGGSGSSAAGGGSSSGGGGYDGGGGWYGR